MASRYLVPFSTLPGAWGGDPMLQLHREMNRLFDDMLHASGVPAPARPGGHGGTGSSSVMVAPRLDVHETGSELSVVAELPGVAPSDVEVRVEGDVLTLSGEKKNESEHKQPNYHVMERSYGRFQRSLQLPFSPDAQQVEASFENGVLTVRIPRQNRQEGARRIPVRASGGAAAGASSSSSAPVPAGAAQGAAAASGSPSSSQSQGPSPSPSPSPDSEPASDARMSAGADGRPVKAEDKTGTVGGGGTNAGTTTHADLLSPDGSGAAQQQAQPSGTAPS